MYYTIRKLLANLIRRLLLDGDHVPRVERGREVDRAVKHAGGVVHDKTEVVLRRRFLHAALPQHR